MFEIKKALYLTWDSTNGKDMFPVIDEGEFLVPPVQRYEDHKGYLKLSPEGYTDNISEDRVFFSTEDAAKGLEKAQKEQEESDRIEAELTKEFNIFCKELITLMQKHGYIPDFSGYGDNMWYHFKKMPEGEITPLYYKPISYDDMWIGLKPFDEEE